MDLHTRAPGCDPRSKPRALLDTRFKRWKVGHQGLAGHRLDIPSLDTAVHRPALLVPPLLSRLAPIEQMRLREGDDAKDDSAHTGKEDRNHELRFRFRWFGFRLWKSDAPKACISVLTYPQRLSGLRAMQDLGHWINCTVRCRFGNATATASTFQASITTLRLELVIRARITILDMACVGVRSRRLSREASITRILRLTFVLVLNQCASCIILRRLLQLRGTATHTDDFIDGIAVVISNILRLERHARFATTDEQ